MRTTIRVIGNAITRASRYLPIRNRAAALASTAKPKDYPGQVAAVFNDFVKRWRYVLDPVGKELVTTSPVQIFQLVMGGRSDDPGAGFGKGVGDCDDATVAIGAQLMSIGFPCRIATIAPEGAPAGNLMSHVFCQAKIPGMGWVTVDPVVYPNQGVFFSPPGSRLAVFSLAGEYLGGSGNIQNMSGDLGSTEKEEAGMLHVNNYTDLAGIQDFGSTPLDFRRYGVRDFGIYSDSMGIMDLGEYGMSLAAEVQTDSKGRAWTPILELRPKDYDYIRANGRAYDGMPALSDDLEVYTYDGMGGFFKKLFKKVRKKARKIAKKLLSKIPGGKYLLRLGKKIHKISMKLIRPLTKFVGKYAKKLAPIAALIPGYGPAIAAGLHASGKIANLMNKVGGKIVSKKGEKAAKVTFPSGKAAKKFQADLIRAAKKEESRGGSLKRPAGRRRPSRGRRRAPIRRSSRRASPRRSSRAMVRR